MPLSSSHTHVNLWYWIILFSLQIVHLLNNNLFHWWRAHAHEGIKLSWKNLSCMKVNYRTKIKISASFYQITTIDRYNLSCTWRIDFPLKRDINLLCKLSHVYSLFNFVFKQWRQFSVLFTKILTGSCWLTFIKRDFCSWNHCPCQKQTN